ncbi:hypothetical protein [Shewanella seohaensis]|uniref:hypothetical protein n=1 Tax=Shewanella seohaensis TaxID=755175 RepID=UPI0035B8C84C
MNEFEPWDQETVEQIKQDPTILKLLAKLPPHIADSYTKEQLMGIRVALGDRTWGKHFIDNRGTFALPFIKWRFYYVFLLGKNRRAYTRREKRFSLVMFSLYLAVYLVRPVAVISAQIGARYRFITRNLTRDLGLV